MPGGVIVGDSSLCCSMPVQCVTSIVPAQLLPIVCWPIAKPFPTQHPRPSRNTKQQFLQVLPASRRPPCLWRRSPRSSSTARRGWPDSSDPCTYTASGSAHSSRSPQSCGRLPCLGSAQIIHIHVQWKNIHSTKQIFNPSELPIVTLVT